MMSIVLYYIIFLFDLRQELVMYRATTIKITLIPQHYNLTLFISS